MPQLFPLFLQRQLNSYGAFLRTVHFCKEEILQQNMFLGLFLRYVTKSQYFYRSHHPAHFTASCWFVDVFSEQVLLLEHRKLKRWLQPGGHCDGSQDALQVAIRELHEETGVSQDCFLKVFSQSMVPLHSGMVFDLDVHAIPAIGNEPGHLHWDIRYLFLTESSDLLSKLCKNDESLDVRFFALRDLEKVTHEKSLLRMRDKYLQAVYGEFFGKGVSHEQVGLWGK